MVKPLLHMGCVLIAISLRPCVKRQCTRNRVSYSAATTRGGIALKIVERHATARTLSLHKVRAVALRSDNTQ